MDYKINLDNYCGPLDLLLYLIKRDEIDIYDIPIAKILEQYLAFVEALKKVDLELAGEFIVFAAQLMEIKSQMLLPREKVSFDDENLVDPRENLVKQLIEYKKFKETSDVLLVMQEDQNQRFKVAKVELNTVEEEQAKEIDEVSLWDLLAAYSKIVKQILQNEPETIVDDELPVSKHMDDIMNILGQLEIVSFSKLFENKKSKSMLIGTFLAILELIRLQKIEAEQISPFGQIYLKMKK